MKRAILSLLCLMLTAAIALCEINRTLNQAQSMYQNARTEADYVAAKKKFLSASADPGYEPAEHDAAIAQGIKNCNAKIAQFAPQPQKKPKGVTINSVEFCSENINDEKTVGYGETLYKDLVCYVMPRITYTSPNEQTKEVYYKFIWPDGRLSHNDSSPEGFSCKESITFKSGTNSYVGLGRGWKDPGNFDPGTYQYEVWIDGKCAYSTSFTIVARNAKPITINGIEFGSTNYDGNVVVDYGKPLYKEDVLYVSPRISYTANKDQTKTVYTKYIWPDGSLSRNDSSPEGFSSKQEVTFRSGTNSYVGLGRGWKDPGNFTPGTYKYEVWIDGECAYSTSFVIKQRGTSPIKISRVEYGSTNYDGDVVVDYGNRLYMEDVRFISPRITYSTDTEQTKTVYYKFFYQDGTLMKSDNSPAGYSHKQDVTFKAGTNKFVATGRGWRDAGKFSPGVYNFEIWIDGAKVYSSQYEIF